MFLDIFNLSIGSNICKLPRMRKRVTIAGPFHEVRSSCLCVVQMREIDEELQLAGLKRRRKTLPR